MPCAEEKWVYALHIKYIFKYPVCKDLRKTVCDSVFRILSYIFTVDLKDDKLKSSSHFTHILFDYHLQHLPHTSTDFVTSCLCKLQVSRYYYTCVVEVDGTGNCQFFSG